MIIVIALTVQTLILHNDMPLDGLIPGVCIHVATAKMVTTI